MSNGVNKKLLAVGALMMVAMAAMAMVYYSDYATATITARNLLAVSVTPENNVTWAPKLFTEIIFRIYSYNEKRLEEAVEFYNSHPPQILGGMTLERI